MTRTEKAIELRKKGFNCAQAVALSFCEDLNLDREIVSKGMEGFGGGMGGYNLTCGALSAAVYIAGIINSDGSLTAPSSKRDTYAICKNICESFKEECGSHFCGEIKGLSSGTPLKSCDECIACGVKLAEKALKD